MKKQQKIYIQDWLPFDFILNNGCIKLKNGYYIKILKVHPVNFNLKSNLEKEAILNSYKIFLKTCNFDIQIIIQSNKEDLSKSISKIEKQMTNENDKIISISQKYIDYIKKINQTKRSASKNFYILIKNSNKNLETIKSEEIILEELTEQYFKIKDCLARAGNNVINITNKEEIKNIYFSFFNIKSFLNSL